MTHQTRILAAGALILAAGAAANAGTVVHSGSLTPASTNWTHTFFVPQFNDLGGALTLEEVLIETTTTMLGSMRAENRDAAARTITLGLNADMKVKQGLDELIHSVASMTEVFDADPYDGLIDFGGASGATFAGLMETEFAANTRTAPGDDLSAWIGLGMVALDAEAKAQSFFSGGGNLTTFFQSQAGLDYTVTYVFRGEVVPMPTAAGLAAAGLGGLTCGRRRRRKTTATGA